MRAIKPRLSLRLLAFALVLSFCFAAESPNAAPGIQFAVTLTKAFPPANATNVCPDTSLRLSFPAPPALGAEGKIRIHDAADHHVVETIDVSSPAATKSIGGASYQYYPLIVTGSEVTVFPRHGVLGYDKTYVSDCYVEGDVDFVWGSGTVYFNHCELKALNNGYLVQSRNGPDRLGDIFVDCRLTTTPNVTNYILARIEPGRFPHSHVAFLNCAMGPHVAPAGWKFDAVPGAAAPGTVDRIQFQEYKSTDLDGGPLDVRQRLVPSKQLTGDEARALRNVARVLGGDDNWNPALQKPRR